MRKVRVGRRLVAQLALPALLFSAVAVLLFPETYRAQTVLLPPERPGSLGVLSAALGESMVMDLLQNAGRRALAETSIKILQSRSVADSVVLSLGLLRDYGLERLPRALALERARRILKGTVTFRAGDAGAITIEAERRTGWLPLFHPAHRAWTRRRCAETADAFGAQLDRVNLERTVGPARATRIYLETRLAQNRRDHERANRALSGFLAVHGAIPLEDRARVLVEEAGVLKSAIMEEEIKLGLVERTDDPSSPRARTLRSTIQEMKRRYDELGLRKLPDLAVQYAALLREAKAQDTLYRILTRRYYAAKLQEANDISTVSVVDAAVAPPSARSPKRLLSVLTAGVLGMLAGAVWILASEEVNALKEEVLRGGRRWGSP